MTSRGARRLLPPVTALLLVGWTMQAVGESHRFELEWIAPRGCPSGAALHRRLEELLGAPVDSYLSRELTVRARIVETADGFALNLTTRTGDGEGGVRHLAGATCNEVAAAGAVIIAMSVDPDAVRAHSADAVAAFEWYDESDASAPDAQVSTEESPNGAPETARTPAPEPEPQTDVATNATRRAEQSAEFVAGFAGIVDAGTLPRFAPGIAAAVGLRFDRWRAEVDAAAFPDQFARNESEEDKGGSIWLWAAGPGLCYLLVPGMANLGTCASLEIGRMYGSGSGLSNPADDQVLWVATRASLDFGLTTDSPLALRVRGQALVPVLRPKFYYTLDGSDLETVHQPAGVGGRLSVGLEISF